MSDVPKTFAQMFAESPMKPTIILPPKAMSDADIEILRANSFCVVVAENPAAVKFLDPIPAIASRTKIEDAAIRFSRRILKGEIFRDNRRDFCQLFFDCLVEGTPLHPDGTDEEREQKAFEWGKRDEFERLGREEAKAERAAKKALAVKPKGAA